MIRPAAKMQVSKFIKELGTLTKGKNSIYRQAGSQLRQALLDEFKVLVRETPQYSGSTAASWKIGFYQDLDSSAIELPQPASTLEALQKGSEPACSYAINNAMGALSNDLKEYARSDITLHNEAPGFDTAEEGPVRQVNTPPGALKRFEGRVASMEILVDFPKI